jgi:hypothetical protein
MPRFVILAHDHPEPHWDLFLEDGSALRSWRLGQLPEAEANVSAEPTPNHRLDYLDYEGPVSDARGSVKRVESGEFEWIADDPNCLIVRVASHKLTGELEIRQFASTWICSFNPE